MDEIDDDKILAALRTNTVWRLAIAATVFVVASCGRDSVESGTPAERTLSLVPGRAWIRCADNSHVVWHPLNSVELGDIREFLQDPYLLLESVTNHAAVERFSMPAVSPDMTCGYPLAVRADGTVLLTSADRKHLALRHTDGRVVHARLAEEDVERVRVVDAWADGALVAVDRTSDEPEVRFVSVASASSEQIVVVAHGPAAASFSEQVARYGSIVMGTRHSYDLRTRVLDAQDVTLNAPTSCDGRYVLDGARIVDLMTGVAHNVPERLSVVVLHDGLAYFLTLQSGRLKFGAVPAGLPTATPQWVASMKWASDSVNFERVTGSATAVDEERRVFCVVWPNDGLFVWDGKWRHFEWLNSD